MEHERWMAERRADGWMLGAARDGDHKISPYLVEWHELPEEARKLDRQAVREIPSILSLAGHGVRRVGDRGGGPSSTGLYGKSGGA